jgi:hypothetical protein
MEKGGMHTGHWWESKNKTDCYKDQGTGGWIILKWILEKKDVVVWTG